MAHDENRTVLAQRIKDAADEGSNIINLSFKTIKSDFTSCGPNPQTNINNDSPLMLHYYYNWDYGLVRNAITYAVRKNCVVVAAAGNTNGDLEGGATRPCENIPYPCYPAEYDNVIAVSGSATGQYFC